MIEDVKAQVEKLSPKAGDVLVITVPDSVRPEVLRELGDALRGKFGETVRAVVLDSRARAEVVADFRGLQYDAHANSRAKGFWPELDRHPGGSPLATADVHDQIPTKIALMHSELSEALEEYRNGHDPAAVRIENGKPEGFPAELADTVIRLFDLCGALGIDLATAVQQKMAYNATRPHRHGGKRA